MENIEKNEQSCMDLKLWLITEILNASCDNNKSLDFLNEDWLEQYLMYKPLTLEMYKECKKRFDKHFFSKQGYKVENKFTISKNEINRIVNDNVDKTYMHIFFIDDNGSLNIIFRFSDLEEFDKSDGNLNLGNDKAYWLQSDGSVRDVAATPSFTSIVDIYRKGAVNNLVTTTLNNSNATEYIVYKMEAIKNFKDFEDDLEFETIIPKENRLSLAVYIKDSDRIHHIEVDEQSKLIPVHDGYYDLGNLKP
ncbi:hypothetical protein [Chryseobacterium sp. POE27]|uniref:hypothetical protein n=1 Tax=Chryseobacterium sp. POE27 TaxID=3138177 RepID=UPI00321C32EA